MKIDTTRVGRYRVMDGVTELSRHNDSTEAQTAAANRAITTPGKKYTVQPPVIEVVATADIMPTPTPVPVPTPVPTPVPEPVPPPTSVGTTIDFIYPNPIDGSALTTWVSGDSIIFVSPTGAGTGTQDNPAHPSIVRNLGRGTIVMFRGGDYRGNYMLGWSNSNFSLGAEHSGISLVGMPGEIAKIISPSSDDYGCINLANGSSQPINPQHAAHDVTIAGLTLVGGATAISGGGFITERDGARNATIVGCDITARYTGNTMSAVINLQGDGWRILGNTLHDFGTPSPINNNHAIYIACGASNVEVAYNKLLRLRLGHQIQIHTDQGGGWTWKNVRVHHNLLDGEVDANGNRIGDARGVTVSTVADDSTIFINDNIFRNLGQNFGATCVYHGVVDIFGNVYEHINGPAILLSNQGGGTRRVTEYGNTFTDVGQNFKFESYDGTNLSSELVHL